MRPARNCSQRDWSDSVRLETNRDMRSHNKFIWLSINLDGGNVGVVLPAGVVCPPTAVGSAETDCPFPNRARGGQRLIGLNPQVQTVAVSNPALIWFWSEEISAVVCVTASCALVNCVWSGFCAASS